MCILCVKYGNLRDWFDESHERKDGEAFELDRLYFDSHEERFEVAVDLWRHGIPPGEIMDKFGIEHENDDDSDVPEWFRPVPLIAVKQELYDRAWKMAILADKDPRDPNVQAVFFQKAFATLPPKTQLVLLLILKGGADNISPYGDLP